MKILFLDVETGGMDEIKQSLLSIGLTVWEDSKILDELEIFISKEKYDYVAAALNINKINLDELRAKGTSEEDSLVLLNEFCNKHFGSNKIIIGGHNVAFDIGFIKALYRRNNQEFYDRFSYRLVDTGTLLRFLFMQGVFDEDISSSDKAFAHFDIKFEEGERHSALGDARATALLFTKLLEINNKNINK